MVLPLPPYKYVLVYFPKEKQNLLNIPLELPTFTLGRSYYACILGLILNIKFLARSHCPHQVKTVYLNLCLNLTHLLNLGCPLPLMLPSLHIHCLSCYHQLLHCFALTSSSPVSLQVLLQRPHAPAKQLPQGHLWGL
jgi:hypothetical protein